jgi:plastocyanin
MMPLAFLETAQPEAPSDQSPTAGLVVDLPFGALSKHPVQASRSTLERNATMTGKHVWVASLAAVVITAIALLLTGSPNATANDQPSSANAEIQIENFSFGPQTVTVPVGATVTWTNRDDTPHTVVSTDGVFKSKVRDTDEKFSYTFTTAGAYPYYCSVHPKMTGQIIVR